MMDEVMDLINGLTRYRHARAFMPRIHLPERYETRIADPLCPFCGGKGSMEKTRRSGRVTREQCECVSVQRRQGG